MKPIDPAELSAFLDGELDEARAREVEAQLAADPALAAEFAKLEIQDAALRAAASAAAFTPAVRMPQKPMGALWLALAGGAGLLVALRIAPRILEGEGAGFVLQAFVLALMLAGVAWLAVAEGRGETSSPATT